MGCSGPLFTVCVLSFLVQVTLALSFHPMPFLTFLSLLENPMPSLHPLPSSIPQNPTYLSRLSITLHLTLSSGGCHLSCVSAILSGHLRRDYHSYPHISITHLFIHFLLYFELKDSKYTSGFLSAGIVLGT